jgi:glycosyltransferase involved in cell wall biosynthesis
MSSTIPLISVLFCVYNGEKYLKQSIDSILNQTYENWEMIAIDDGSTDSSLKTLQEYAQKDSRIKVYTQKNIGLTKSLNKAIKLSSGEYIARQDADDISSQDRFILQIKEFEKDGVVLVTGKTEVVNIQNRTLIVTSPPKDFEEMKKTIFKLNNPFTHGSLMIKKSFLEKINGYDENFISAQDFDMIIRLSNQGKFKVIDDVIYKLRKHPESITVKRWTKQFKYSFMFAKSIKNNYSEYNKWYYLIKANVNLIIRIFLFGFISSKSNYYLYLGNLALQKGNKVKAKRCFLVSSKRSCCFFYGWYKYMRLKYA